jgi:hypothetical protein
MSDKVAMEGRAVMKRRALALMSSNEDDVYPWDRHYSKAERESFAALLLECAGEPEPEGES